MKVDAHHATFLRDGLDDVIRHVPHDGVTPFAEEWDASTGAALSSTASSTALSEMCDTSTIIPIRFISRTSSRPELRQSIVGFGVRHRIGKGIRFEMGQRHVANSHPVERAQYAETVGDQVAALEARQGGHFARFMDTLDIGRGIGELHVGAIGCYFTMKRFQTFQGAGKPCLRWIVLRLCIDTKKHSAQLAFLHPWDIEFVISVLVGKTISFVNEVPRRINVRVEDENIAHQSIEAVLSRENTGAHRQNENHSMHATKYTTRTQDVYNVCHFKERSHACCCNLSDRGRCSLRANGLHPNPGSHHRFIRSRDPGRGVTASRVETGDRRTTTSNETGNYIFPLVDSGTYDITCSASGFKTEIRRNITLELNQKGRIDFQLQIGQQAETVEVSASAPLLKTEDATLGSVVEHKRIIELPLNGRNFAQAATLMPGVVYGSARMGVDGQQTIGTRAMPGQIVGISANGQRDANQNITLDGVSATDGFKSSMLFVPSIEAIEEFKIQSAVYSAEYGMNSGAQANVAIKSGTNQWHGSAFEFVRNDTFDARGYFLAPNQPKNKLRRNQFGGVLSGPIRRDATFFLVNYEGRRERRGTPARTTVPTLAMREGDLSEILQPGNRWYPRDAQSSRNSRDSTPWIVNSPSE